MKYLLIAVLFVFSVHASARTINFCDESESGFVDLVGNMALGSSFTAVISGEIVVWTLTNQGWITVAAIPAVPTLVAGAAFTASAIYVGLKAHCASEEIVMRTSDWIEIVAKRKRDAIRYGTEVFCYWLGCP